jgi:hypothetical protein
MGAMAGFGEMSWAKHGKTHQKHGNDFTSENEWKWHNGTF